MFGGDVRACCRRACRVSTLLGVLQELVGVMHVSPVRVPAPRTMSVARATGRPLPAPVMTTTVRPRAPGRAWSGLTTSCRPADSAYSGSRRALAVAQCCQQRQPPHLGARRRARPGGRFGAGAACASCFVNDRRFRGQWLPMSLAASQPFPRLWLTRCPASRGTPAFDVRSASDRTARRGG